MKSGGARGADVHAGSAFHAGHERATHPDALFRHGEGGALCHAPFAVYASVLIDADVEDVDPVRQGLHRTEGAKQAALGPALRQQGQDDHQGNEEGDEDDGLHEDLERGNRFEFGYRLERTEPCAIGGAEERGGGQDDGQQDGPGQVAPPGINVLQDRFFQDAGKGIVQPAEKAAPAAPAASHRERRSDPDDEHAGDRRKSSGDRSRKDDRPGEGRGDQGHRDDQVAERHLAQDDLLLAEGHASPRLEHVGDEGDDKQQGKRDECDRPISIGLPRMEHQEKQDIEEQVRDGEDEKLPGIGRDSAARHHHERQ